jgi:hypothetical protein
LEVKTVKSPEILSLSLRKSIFNHIALLFFCGAVLFFAHQASASGVILGKVLELEGVVESRMPGEKSELLRPGMTLIIGAELKVNPDSWVVLTMADNTVRKFSGPATITMTENPDQERGSVLTRLGSALAGMLFAQEQEGSEVVMVTRDKREGELVEAATAHIPVLVRPAPGSNLLEKPTKLEWVNVDGIPLYRVSVYGWDRLLWQGTTSNSAIECPPEHCQFEPEAEYYWLVEGLIGNSALRSEPAKFKVLPENVRSELSQTISDQGLPVTSKVRLCMSLNLYHTALELVDSYVSQRPSDAEAYRLRAEIKGMMGLHQDAFFDYFKASQMSSGK